MPHILKTWGGRMVVGSVAIVLGGGGVWLLYTLPDTRGGVPTARPAKLRPEAGTGPEIPKVARYDIQLKGQEWVRVEHLIPALWCYSIGGPDVERARIRFADGRVSPIRGRKFGPSDPVSLALDRKGNGMVHLWVWPSATPTCP